MGTFNGLMQRRRRRQGLEGIVPGGGLLWGAVLAVGLVVVTRRRRHGGGQEAPIVATVTGYKAGQPIQVELVEVAPGKQLAAAAGQAFLAMVDAARADGFELHVNSGFRSMEKQEELYAVYQAGGNLAARPGHSNHQSGEAVDIGGTEGGTSSLYYWLAANTARFGFCRTVRSEPHHWEYRTARPRCIDP